jgi:hypothetical protein
MRTVRPTLTGASVLSAAGHATKNEIVREIVEIAVRSHKSPQWPVGRSVTIKDMRATISDNKRAGELHKHLVASGRLSALSLATCARKRSMDVRGSASG